MNEPPQAVELVGGWPALELANTLNSRPLPTRDAIATHDGLIDWAIIAGLIAGQTVADLRGTAAPEAALALREVHALRETVYRIFSAVAGGRPAARRDLDDLVGVYLRTVRFAALQAPPGGGYELAWLEPAAIAGPLAQSAIDLLRTGPLDRVKECPSCGWLFLDRSKNRGRRWCSMATCGSRAKMRRYHGRKAAARTGRRVGGRPPRAGV